MQRMLWLLAVVALPLWPTPTLRVVLLVAFLPVLAEMLRDPRRGGRVLAAALLTTTTAVAVVYVPSAATATVALAAGLACVAADAEGWRRRRWVAYW